jgi:hypothetical protein
VVSNQQVGEEEWPTITIKFRRGQEPLLNELWRGSRMVKPVKVLRLWDVLVPLSSRGVATFLEMSLSRCVLISRAMSQIVRLRVSLRTKMDILRLVVWLGTPGVETLDVRGSIS